MKAPPTTDDKRFLTVCDLAQETRETISAWRRRLLRRQIAFVKCGKNVRVSRETFEKWLAERVVQAETTRSKPDGAGR